MRKNILFLFIAVLCGYQIVSFSGIPGMGDLQSNPFSEYMHNSGGVNLYSGDAAFSYPLVADLNLNYSSHVYKMALTGNDQAPAGWVGLGWSLGVGAVVRDHKGTIDHFDDNFYWISPTGVTSQIKRKNNLGVKYDYYEFEKDDNIQWTEDLNSLTVKESGIINDLNVSVKKKTAYFGIKLQAYLYIPADTIYQFYIRSDDGSRFRLYDENQQNVLIEIDNDGHHSTIEKQSDSIFLSGKTFYKIEVDYFNGSGESDLIILLRTKYFGKIKIPSWWLFVKPSIEEEYYVEDFPYYKVEPYFDQNRYEAIDGWTVTDCDGKKYHYGITDPDDHPGNKAIRYVISFKDIVIPVEGYKQFVRNGFSGETEQFPYRWDLVTIEDVFGNKIDYGYQQYEEIIKTNTWQSSVGYTKESYLKNIWYPNGKRVEFVLEEKPYEPYDPNTIESEPDAHMEIYERHRLKKIKSYSHKMDENPVSIITFDYDKLKNVPSEMGDKYIKNLLSKITVTNHEPDGNHKVFKQTEFTYNDDYSKIGDANYNYGALTEVRDESGSLTEFDYQRINTFPELEKNKIIDAGFNFKLISAGFRGDGEEFVIIASDENETDVNRLDLITWDDQKWKKETLLENCNRIQKIVCGYNYFVVYEKGNNDGKLTIFEWNEKCKKWVPNIFPMSCLFAGNAAKKDLNMIYPGNDYIVVTGGDGGEVIWLLQRINDLWALSSYFDGVTRDMPEEVFMGYNYFITKNERDRFAIYTKKSGPIPGKYPFWSGDIEYFLNGSDDIIQHIYPGDDFIVLIGGHLSNVISILNWDGIKWEHDSIYQSKSWDNSIKKTVEIGKDFVIISPSVNENTATILNKIGNRWRSQDINISNNSTIGCGKDYAVVGDTIYHWNGAEWIAKENAPSNVFCCYNDFFSAVSMGTVLTKTVVTYSQQRLGPPDSDDYITVKKITCYYDRTFALGTWAKDGERWNKEHLYNNQTGSQIFLSTIGIGDLEIIAWGNKIHFYRKFNGAFKDSSLFSFAVRKKTKRDIKGVEEKEEYNYSFQNYDFQYGMVKNNQVEVTQPDGGKIISYFFNSTSFNDQETFLPDADAWENDYDGFRYRTIIMDNSDKVIKEDTTLYDTYTTSHWPPNIFSTVLRSNRSQIHMSKSTRTFEYDYNLGYNHYHNGLPRITISELNENTGKTLHNFKLFASELYPYKGTMGKGGAHMLTQPAMQLTLENFNSASANSFSPGMGGFADPELDYINWADPSINWFSYISKDKIRNATTTTWSDQHTVNNVWAPYQTYVWNVPLDASGKPVQDFDHPFNFFDIPSNTSYNWKYTGAITKYDRFGNAVEVEKPHGTGELRYSASIFNTLYNLQIASVANARYNDCAVYTCDYDDPDPGYLDKYNEWEEGECFEDGDIQVRYDQPHFGTRSLYVYKSFGPTKNIKGFDEDRDYVFSAWIYPEISNPMRFVVEPHANGSSSLTGTIIDDYISNLQVQKWQYVSVKIPSSKIKNEWDLGDNSSDYMRIWIGNHPGDPAKAKFYVDDIRFYPADAHVGTNYYDLKWRKLVTAVGANNQPGKRMEYDEFGREKNLYTMKHNDDNTKIMEKEYHFAGLNKELFTPIIDSVRTNYAADPDELTFYWRYYIPVGEVNEEEDITYTIHLNYLSKSGDTSFVFYHTAKSVVENLSLTITADHNLKSGTYSWFIIASDGVNSVKAVDNSNFYYFPYCNCPTCGPEGRCGDSLALVELYNSTDGANWTNKTNWLTSSPIDTWYGITVSGERVTRINLGQNGLNGTIPVDMGSMSSLTSLKLHNNSLSGPIPSELGYLSNLTELILSTNALSDTIPSSLGDLTLLQNINLSSNNLTGSIPVSFGNLTSLVYLQITSNELSGSIPDTLCSLTNLQYLILPGNNLSGSIPSRIGNLINLRNLILYDNNLQGSIPVSLGNLINLRYCDLQTNQLTGSIPDTLGNLGSVIRIRLDENQLYGSIPASLGELQNLTYLNLSHNYLNGSIPGNLGQAGSLAELYLSYNDISGTVPDSLAMAFYLQKLYLRDNQLADIGDAMANLVGLTALDLGGNRLCSLSTWVQQWANTYDPDWESTQICHDIHKQQLTNNLYNDENLSISGDAFVWCERIYSTSKLHLYDTELDTAIQIADNSVDNKSVDVFGKTAVWLRRLNSNYEVMKYDNGTTTQITSNAISAEKPVVSFNLVAWRASDGADYEIYLNDTTHTINISDNSFNDSCPQIGGAVVVWMMHDGNDWEIMYYNDITEEHIQITDNTVDDCDPQVNPFYITWRQYDTVDAEHEIYYYDIANDTTVQVSNDTMDDGQPFIHDNTIVWTKHRAANDDELYRYDITNDTTIQLTNDTIAVKQCGGVSGQYVPFIGSSNGTQWYVYLFDGTQSIRQSENGFPFVEKVLIHKDNVGWAGADDSNHDTEIFWKYLP